MSSRSYCYVKTKTLDAKKIYAGQICAGRLCLQDRRGFIGATGVAGSTGATGNTGATGPSGSFPFNALQPLLSGTQPTFGAGATFTVNFLASFSEGDVITFILPSTINLADSNSLYLVTLGLIVDVSGTTSSGNLLVNLNFSSVFGFHPVIQDQRYFSGPGTIQMNSAMQLFVGLTGPLSGTLQLSSSLSTGDPVLFTVTSLTLVISLLNQF